MIQYKNSLCKEILWQASCAVLLNLVLTSFESALGTPKLVLKAHTIAQEEMSQCDERERVGKMEMFSNIQYFFNCWHCQAETQKLDENFEKNKQQEGHIRKRNLSGLLIT